MDLEYKDWNIESLTGYKPLTTYYQDFSIADHFGEQGVIDTYNEAFEACKDDYEYITELVMVLNWKIWEHYETNPKLAELYNDLWMKADNWVMENLKDDELQYFLRTTD